MSNNQFIFELYINDSKFYKNFEINYVFHEYLNYMNEKKNYTLIIKKKLHDDDKKYPLYLETIIYNPANLSFCSVENNNYYQINNYNYLYNLVNLTNNNLSNNNVNNNTVNNNTVTNNTVTDNTVNSTQKLNKKMLPIKIQNKIKVVDYDTNINTENIKESEHKCISETDRTDRTDRTVETDKTDEIDEQKLFELEKMIKDLEDIKDKNLIQLKEKQQLIANKDMEERYEKSKEKTYDDKRKEINNIFENDKRLYYNFKDIINEIQKQKDNINENNIDNRRPSELKKYELTARIHITNNKEFEIPILFKHKYPIFEFMNQNNLLDHEKSFLVFKIIYYTNYELDTESRKYFGNKVYLLNDNENLIFEETFNNEQKIAIREFNDFINKKPINIEKIISSSMNESKKGFEKTSGNDYKNMFDNNIINEEESDDYDSDEDSEIIIN